MVLEVDWIAPVLVEICYCLLLACPHINVMLGVSEMGSQARSKVSCPENENLGYTYRLRFCVIHSKSG